MTVFPYIAFSLALAFLSVILAFIALFMGAFLWRVVIETFVSKNAAPRLRLPKNRAPRRTLIITPDHNDPRIVGDVTQAQYPKAHYPHSRANVKGEG